MGFGIGDEGDHVSEKGVGSDVEGNPETEITRSLVHETGEKGFRSGRGIGRGKSDVELAEHVARREGHNPKVWENESGEKKNEKKTW